LGEPFTKLCGIALQALDALRLLGGQIGFDSSFVFGAVARQQPLHGRFELAGLSREVRARTASGLRGAARQFDPVNGEHLPANQALAVADEQHLSEDVAAVVSG
jgi:hypothetical protein